MQTDPGDIPMVFPEVILNARYEVVSQECVTLIAKLSAKNAK